MTSGWVGSMKLTILIAVPSVADTGMFSQIHSADAALLAPGDVDNDGSDELAVSLAAAGTWIYDDDTGIFSQIHTVDAALLAAGDR